ncbi:hypothetical protein BDW74DRAFT_178893 [Aspergillus multicolor]|uniref:Zn(II)2Cys6 transcription factor n=1 Tax=Aspergillus multicolor TaxID=41759 RepID=UPI003CCE3413
MESGRINKRTAKACQSCRRRKVRCHMEGGAPCRACQRRSSPCILAAVSGRAMDEMSYLDPSETADVSIKEGYPAWLPMMGEAGFGLAPNISDHTLSYDDFVGQEQPDPLSSLLCFNLPRSHFGQPGSSPLSIFSSAGKQWLQNAVGDEPLDWGVLTPLFPSDPPNLDMNYPPFRRPFIPLPPKQEARHLLSLYFQSFNTFCPTFDEQEFMLHFELEYPTQPEPSAGKWACLNAALALAASLNPTFSAQAGLFWKNATMSWGAFFTEAPSVCSAQALVAMAVYSLGTFQNQPCSTLIPMAIRTLHGLPPGETVGPKQLEIVSMIARSMDIDHALQSGASPTNLNSGGVYRAIPIQELGLESLHPFDFYDAFCALTCLKEDVYRGLYSVSAQEKTDSEVLARIGVLDARLEGWKHTIPVEYRPEHASAAEAIKQGCVLVIYLHLSYYNCLLAIHRRAAPFTAGSLRLDPSYKISNALRSSNPRTLVSSRLCAEASRASLKLAKFIPVGSQLVCGMMISYVVFALKLLVILIVHDPRGPRVHLDIFLIRNLEAFLSQIPINGGDKSTTKLREYCEQYRQIAENAIKQVLIQKKQ